MSVFKPISTSELRKSVSAIYNSIAFDLSGDVSQAANDFKETIDLFLTDNIASPYYLEGFYSNILAYQRHLGGKFGLSNAVHKIASYVKSVINMHNIGYARGGGGDFTYQDLLLQIQDAVRNLPEDVSVREIITAIAASINAGEDEDLIHKMESDFELLLLWYIGDNQIDNYLKEVILGIDQVENSASIVQAIYSNEMFVIGSALQGYLTLGADINNNYYANGVSYAETLTNIYDGLSALQGDYTKPDIANVFASSMNATNDSDLINYLNIDLYSSNHNASTIVDDFLNAGNIYEGLYSINELDGSSIAMVIYWMMGLGGFASAFKGLTDFSEVITSDSENNQLTYSQIWNNIQAEVGNLEGDYAVIDVINAVAASVNATDNIDFINHFSLDVEMTSHTAAQLAHNVLNATVNPIDGPSIALAIYNNINVNIYSILQGAIALTDAVYLEHHAHNVYYSDIVSNVKNRFSSITDDLSKDDIAVTIADALNAQDNDLLIETLQLDLISSSSNSSYIISQIAQNTEGTDPASIAISIYESFNDAWLSVSRGAVAFETDIVNYYDSMNLKSLTRAIGESNLAPKTNFYLNRCSVDDNEVYTVGVSVLLNFDISQQGILLSDMPELNTKTGNKAAMAQCSDWIENSYENQNDMYLTTSKARGTVGTADETGCLGPLDSGSALMKCHSIFDVSQCQLGSPGLFSVC